jgi:FkbM family methyltransferase
MNPARLIVADRLRPFNRWAPRGYGFLYKLLLGKYSDGESDPELKQKLARRYRVFFDRKLDAYVVADLADWTSRSHYYRGVHYDRNVPLLIDRLLTRGGTFFDVGANRGIHSLHAARVLDGRGHVFSFEPNPATFDELKAHLTINKISNCTAFNIGIAAASAELELNLFKDDHSGTCSFLASGEVASTVSVPVRPLDDVVDAKALQGPIFVKIDVEGYEHEVLKGMKRILARHDVTVLCELTDRWLLKLGSSVESVMADMASHGYRILYPKVRYRHVATEILDLLPESPHEAGRQFDAVFVRAGAAV